ncbi:MAG: phosphoribosylformylglycinamidine synthase subunit PurQ, partial [Flavobacteriaceae bacterium]
ITAGHDIGSGGLVTTLLEMCFPSTAVGMEIDFSALTEKDLIKILFSEKVGVVLQSKENLTESFAKAGINVVAIGKVNSCSELTIGDLQLSLPAMRQYWMATSTKLEAEQTTPKLAATRGSNIVAQPLKFNFPHAFDGKKPAKKKTTIKAAVIREKGSNSEREMAYMMDLSGFEVRDVHMTDLI